MKGKCKKFLASVLAAAMVLPTIGTSVFATESTVVTSWNYIDDYDAMTYVADTNSYELFVPNATEENPLTRDALASFLPVAITAEFEVKADEIPMEDTTQTEDSTPADETVPSEEDTTAVEPDTTEESSEPDVSDNSGDTEEPDILAEEPETTPPAEDPAPDVSEDPTQPDTQEQPVEEPVPDNTEVTEPAEEPNETAEVPADEPETPVEDPAPEIIDPVMEEVIPAGAHVLDITWDLSNYPKSAWEGQYIITASLPDGYVLADDAIPMAVKVVLSDIAATLDEPRNTDEPDTTTGYLDAPMEGIGTVDTVSKEESGIKFMMFDYSPAINLNEDTDLPDAAADYATMKAAENFRAVAPYFNFRGATYDPVTKDATALTGPTPGINDEYDKDGFYKQHATVMPTLNEVGYPVLDFSRYADGNLRADELNLNETYDEDDRKLDYLFGGTDDEGHDEAVSAYEAINTLLQLGRDGFYRYNSRENAVDFDKDEKEFLVRNYVERSKSTTNYKYKPTDNYYDFLPFTYWDNETTKTNYDLDAKQEDGKALGYGKEYNYDYNPNYWFGMTMEADFFMPEDGKINGEEMTFHFSGDDDVWVFIDGVLVLDLGGTHGVVDGTINFTTGEVKQYINWAGESYGTSGKSFDTTIFDRFSDAGKVDEGETWTTFIENSKHTLKMFYMERGSGSANCMLEFNLPTQPENALTVAKTVQNIDKLKSSVSDDLTYSFRITGADGEPIITEGTEYTLKDSDGSETDGLDVGANGIFTLKNGQSAEFENMSEYSSNEYYVEELIAVTDVDLYNKVAYNTDGAVSTFDIEDLTSTVTLTDATGTAVEYKVIKTSSLSIVDAHSVKYTNVVDTDVLCDLTVKKEVDPESDIPEDETFDIEIKFDSVPAEGTEYVLYDAEGNPGEPEKIGKDGIITLKDKEYITIKGILSGTNYEVTELDDEYKTSYRGTVTIEQQTTDLDLGRNPVNAKGEFPEASSVTVIIRSTISAPSTGGSGSSKDKIRVTVEKEWKVPNDVEHPDSVKVRLYVDGAAHGKLITLDEDNDWTYTWSGIDEDADWEVKEVSEPEGYEVSYETKGNKVTVTNTYKEPDIPSDPTTPTTPTDPTVPVTPATPVVPVDPIVPETPADPNASDKPEVELDDKTPSEKDPSTSERDPSDPPVILDDTDTVDPSVPQTGDNNHIILFSMICILSLGGLFKLARGKGK